MRIPDCWICMDLGFLLYNSNGYETICHCTCPAGPKWTYDGRQCEKHRSRYYIQSVEELFDVQEIAGANIEKWTDRNKDDPDTMRALKSKIYGRLGGDEDKKAYTQRRNSGNDISGNIRTI